MKQSMHCAKEKQCDASFRCTMNNIVILGNKGFIGTHLENYLKSKKISVQGMDMPDVDLTQQNAIEKLSSAFDQSSAVVFLSCIKKEHGDTFDIFLKNFAMGLDVLETRGKKKKNKTPSLFRARKIWVGGVFFPNPKKKNPFLFFPPPPGFFVGRGKNLF